MKEVTLTLNKKQLECIAQALAYKHSYDISYDLESKYFDKQANEIYNMLIVNGVDFE
jgi:hypothetical protein